MKAKRPKSKQPRQPKYRRRKRPDGRDGAFVEISGQRIYLGPYDDPASREKYHALLAQAAANGGRLPSQAEGLTVIELIADFMDHAAVQYSRDGRPTSEFITFRSAVRPLNDLYGLTPATEFDARRLKAVRHRMIGLGWNRTHVNGQVNRLKLLFRWAVQEGLVPPSVRDAVNALLPLRKGKTDVPEGIPRQPADDELVDAALPHMPLPVAAMVELMRMTGMRPSEVMSMRPCDLDMSNPSTWLYRPEHHKTAHHGIKRVVHLGPKSQEVIRPYLTRPTTAYLFDPREAMADMREARSAARVTPMSCGNTPGASRVRVPKRQPGNRYRRDSLLQAVHRACDRAFPVPGGIADDEVKVKEWKAAHRFAPYELRHSAATRIAGALDLITAQHVLGHTDVRTTQKYAKPIAEKVAAAALAMC